MASPAAHRVEAAVRRFVLPGGTLDITVRHETMPLDLLCGFAARNNARRGFLIVSRVLGRHLPSRPSAMAAAANALAARIAADLPGPVLFVGLAETAICLGQSVHAAWAAATARDDSLFLHSTRQQLDVAPIATFDEPHSHASAHLLHAPADDTLAARMARARSLVLVDDEASTGTTLVNAARAIRGVVPGIERIVTAVLTDWSDGAAYLRAMPVAASAVALIAGKLDWRAEGTVPVSFDSPFPGALGRMTAHSNVGRRGIDRDPPGIAARAAALAGPAPERLLVLGTGEFTYIPFVLARALEAAGHDVVMQATSRSPVRIGGVIETALTFADNYATGVPNYAYNLEKRGRRVLICHETPRGSVDRALIAALDAETVAFGPDA